MSGLPSNFSLSSRLARGVTSFVCICLCVALVGAARAQSAKATSPRHAEQSAADTTAPETVELLHDDAAMDDAAASEAVLASATISATAKQPKVVWMVVTAYCQCKKCCGPKAQGLTASGRRVNFNGGHFVAADKQFKFGARLIVPGYAGEQPVQVMDRGSAIKGNHIDVFFPSHEQARLWGKRWLAVTVVE